MVTPRFGTIVRHLTDDPGTATSLVGRLPDAVLAHLGVAVNDEIKRRAVVAGDQGAIVANGFETGFGRDGLAVLPWIEGPFVVCPGGLVAKSPASHRCRFVSVEQTWIWESEHLIDEEKRGTPGSGDGFRAVALLPLIDGLRLDVVTGRMRRGEHAVDRVVSLELRGGELVETAQRVVDRTRLADH